MKRRTLCLLLALMLTAQLVLPAVAEAAEAGVFRVSRTIPSSKSRVWPVTLAPFRYTRTAVVMG